MNKEKTESFGESATVISNPAGEHECTHKCQVYILHIIDNATKKLTHPLLNPPFMPQRVLEREEVKSGVIIVLKTSEVFENLRGLVGIKHDLH